MKNLHKFSLLIFSMFLFILQGCGGGGDNSSSNKPPESIVSVSLSPNSVEVGVGEKASITATGITTTGQSVDVTGSGTWGTLDTNIVTVSGGMITGVSVGATSVVFEAMGVKAQAAVSVTSDVVSIDIEDNQPMIASGQRVNLVAKAILKNGEVIDSSSSGTWEVSNDNARVTTSGQLTALKDGKFTLTHSYYGVKATKELEVVTIKQLVPNRSALRLFVGDSEQLTVRAEFVNRTSEEVGQAGEWVAMNETRATVDNGLVTAVGAGQTAARFKFLNQQLDIKVDVLAKGMLKKEGALPEYSADLVNIGSAGHIIEARNYRATGQRPKLLVNGSEVTQLDGPSSITSFETISVNSTGSIVAYQLRDDKANMLFKSIFVHNTSGGKQLLRLGDFFEGVCCKIYTQFVGSDLYVFKNGQMGRLGADGIFTVLFDGYKAGQEIFQSYSNFTFLKDKIIATKTSRGEGAKVIEIDYQGKIIRSLENGLPSHGDNGPRDIVELSEGRYIARMNGSTWEFSGNWFERPDLGYVSRFGEKVYSIKRENNFCAIREVDSAVGNAGDIIHNYSTLNSCNERVSHTTGETHVLSAHDVFGVVKQVTFFSNETRRADAKE